ncbi:E3 ubiquitin-protein ligase CHFR [Fusarium oxysporum f. sp. raphani]|uniref:E3 ubiquitin-protein ligase CHFR n=1 Tax=Fusarium oxysporum f. sp. raphani TaxID=96318 RepID=A0A8J5Q6S8_FUSOX|nr:E3 ubiquitin-protein ligase CHFR [Fusarium oxysporum f. sp. raphani]
MEPTNAGLDLEKELTCSICTELLYQPLTLLDCLHTFCGACLKEWFTFQAATAERAPNPPAPGTNIFTCPSCRAAVRTTQHNATVVTLLDMFIAASPGKDRSAAEKEEMAKKYKPGDQVLPTINTHRTADERRIDAEDRSRHQRRGSRRPRVDDGGRHSSDQLHVEGERRRRRSESRQRQIEHQSSIRSLISSGDMSERDIEREIESFARQIQEEGLLDGLDLDNIDLSRDDELSRRITEAYRRRQRDRTRQEARRNNGNNYPPLTRYAENAAAGDPRMLAPEGGRPRERSRPHSRSASAASATSAASQTEERSRPPTSTNLANLEVQEPIRRPRRRTASGGRSSTTPVFPTTAEPRPAARSSTDLGSRPQASDITQSRPSFSEGRSTSTPIHTVPFPNPTEAASFSNNTGNMSFASRQGTSQSASAPPLFSHHDAAAGRANRPRPVDLAIVHQTVTSPISSPTVSGHQRTRSQLYPEPSVSCSRCNKQHIEYELHYNCSICANGQWNDLVGGQGLKPEAAEKAEHREKGLQKWVWHENGQDLARLVTKDVSETAPSESGFAKSLPPDGGVGLKATARFGWYPRPGADDELLFPKGAEIKEIEDVNGEWFFGAYMGTRGLFPAPYVRLEQDA